MSLSHRLPHWPLLLVLLIGLGLRIALWDHLPREGFISDEAEYLAAADWLTQGRGFAWHQGWLWTRAPLYPLFLAIHLWLFGFTLTPIYFTQTGLSLVNVALVYALAWQVGYGLTFTFQRRVAVIASLVAAVYLPFATYPQILLSETLYLTLLLTAFVVLGRWGHTSRPAATIPQALLLGAAGGLFGLATLTRGLTLGFLPVVVVWIVFSTTGSRLRGDGSPPTRGWTNRQSQIPNLKSQIGSVLVFVICTAGVILPWSVYASRAYGGPVVVDTTGAYNLLLGSRTAYDGVRRDAPPRNFVLALLDPQLAPEERRALVADACLLQQSDPRLLAALDRPVAEISQAERQQLMTAEGLCLLQAAPGAFVSKSLSEFVDLFQINYTGSERMTSGFTLGRLPHWYLLALLLLDDLLYALVLPLAVIGWALARTGDGIRNTGYGLIGLWWLYNLATAPLLFAINRFRLPLLPFAFVFAAYALVVLARGDWRQLRTCYGYACVVLATLLGLIAATPYAYAEPRPAGGDSQWASLLGPYPSSLASTIRAWQARSGYVQTQALMQAMRSGDAETARALLATGDIPEYIQAVALPLLRGLEGDPEAGLALLDTPTIAPLDPWQTAVVRGELLRQTGDWEAARAVLSPTLVDRENPVEWAWQWLHPPPLPEHRIDLGGDLDLGYISGFYLGEGAPDIDGTVRWAGPVSALRFPQAGNGLEQQLCLRADGRGWPGDLPPPALRVQRDGEPVATIDLQRNDVQVYCATLPPTPPEADVVVTLHADTFVPAAADLLGQQGAQASQLRLLGVRLDWAELR